MLHNKSGVLYTEARKVKKNPHFKEFRLSLSNLRNQIPWSRILIQWKKNGNKTSGATSQLESREKNVSRDISVEWRLTLFGETVFFRTSWFFLERTARDDADHSVDLTDESDSLSLYLNYLHDDDYRQIIIPRTRDQESSWKRSRLDLIKHESVPENSITRIWEGNLRKILIRVTQISIMMRNTARNVYDKSNREKDRQKRKKSKEEVGFLHHLHHKEKSRERQ